MFPSLNLPVAKGNGNIMIHLSKSDSIPELQWKIRTQPARKENIFIGLVTSRSVTFPSQN